MIYTANGITLHDTGTRSEPQSNPMILLEVRHDIQPENSVQIDKGEGFCDHECTSRCGNDRECDCMCGPVHIYKRSEREFNADQLQFIARMEKKCAEAECDDDGHKCE